MNDFDHLPTPPKRELSPTEKVVKKIWDVFFLVLYPSLALFGLLYAAFIFVFSHISNALFFFFGLFKKRN